MKNALSVDVEEWFQTEAFRAFFPESVWAAQPSRLEDPLERVLSLLRRYGVHATFFVLGWVAEREPSRVRRLADEGHEIATHGFSHKPLHVLGPSRFRDDLRRSVQLLEPLAGRKIRGFRAPTFSLTEETLWALEILLEEGLEYDSSIFPVRHDRYGIPSAPRVPFRLPERGGRALVEFPPCTVRVGGVNLPAAGGGYLRLYPYGITRWAIRRMNRRGFPAMVYLHPWELDPEQPLPRGSGRFRRWRHTAGIRGNERKVRRLLEDFAFGPAGEVLSRMGLLREGGVGG